MSTRTDYSDGDGWQQPDDPLRLGYEPYLYEASRPAVTATATKSTKMAQGMGLSVQYTSAIPVNTGESGKETEIYFADSMIGGEAGTIVKYRGALALPRQR
ncbi:hypothetical protein [Klebsiella pneumoniae]|uniref:hypothetical protein n=1 Tax=Klebsiella pneumoniae TaxID=573 RepID=UPI003890DF9F